MAQSRAVSTTCTSRPAASATSANASTWTGRHSARSSLLISSRSPGVAFSRLTRLPTRPPVGLLGEPGAGDPAERAQQLLDVLLAADEGQPDTGGRERVGRLPEAVLERGGPGLAGSHMDEDRTTRTHGARVSMRVGSADLCGRADEEVVADPARDRRRVAPVARTTRSGRHRRPSRPGSAGRGLAAAARVAAAVRSGHAGRPARRCSRRASRSFMSPVTRTGSPVARRSLTTLTRALCPWRRSVSVPAAVGGRVGVDDVELAAGGDLTQLQDRLRPRPAHERDRELAAARRTRTGWGRRGSSCRSRPSPTRCRGRRTCRSATGGRRAGRTGAPGCRRCRRRACAIRSAAIGERTEAGGKRRRSPPGAVCWLPRTLNDPTRTVNG